MSGVSPGGGSPQPEAGVAAAGAAGPAAPADGPVPRCWKSSRSIRRLQDARPSAGPCGQGRLAPPPSRRDLRGGRRVGFRQVDSGEGAGRFHPSHRRHGSSGWPRRRIARSGYSPQQGIRNVQMIFQESALALDPRLAVWRSVAEALPPGTTGVGRSGRKAWAVERLAQVGLRAATAARRPSGLSGGEKQRVAIARAMAAQPAIVICDEAVSALDVTVRAAILDLLRDHRGRDRHFLVLYRARHLGSVYYRRHHGRHVRGLDRGAGSNPRGHRPPAASLYPATHRRRPAAAAGSGPCLRCESSQSCQSCQPYKSRCPVNAAERKTAPRHLSDP